MKILNVSEMNKCFGGFYLKSEWFKDAKTAFKKLAPEKQARIIDACLAEFAEEGFETASTNRIAQRAGIAKGSIFKYFGTKEKMFFTVINYILERYLDAVVKRLPEMPEGVVERYAAFIEYTLDFMYDDVKVYRAFSRITKESGGVLMEKVRKKWAPRVEPMMKQLMAGADTDRLSISMHEFARLFTWLDNSINSEVYSLVKPGTTAGEIKKMYRQRIALIIKVMKNGIYRK